MTSVAARAISSASRPKPAGDGSAEHQGRGRCLSERHRAREACGREATAGRASPVSAAGASVGVPSDTRRRARPLRFSTSEAYAGARHIGQLANQPDRDELVDGAALVDERLELLARAIASLRPEAFDLNGGDAAEHREEAFGVRGNAPISASSQSAGPLDESGTRTTSDSPAVSPHSGIGPTRTGSADSATTCELRRLADFRSGRRAAPCGVRNRRSESRSKIRASASNHTAAAWTMACARSASLSVSTRWRRKRSVASRRRDCCRSSVSASAAAKSASTIDRASSGHAARLAAFDGPGLRPTNGHQRRRLTNAGRPTKRKHLIVHPGIVDSSQDGRRQGRRAGTGEHRRTPRSSAPGPSSPSG